MKRDTLQEKLKEPNRINRTIKRVMLGMAISISYMNIMFGFAPTMDLLAKGATKKQIENGRYIVQFSPDGYHHSKKDPIIMKDATIIKYITKPGREAAYILSSILK